MQKFALQTCHLEFPRSCQPVSLNGVHGKRGVGEGLAEKVGEGLVKGWHRVGEGSADFSQF